MALRIPTKVSDRLTLISYIDDAIDFDAASAGDCITDYVSADVPDRSTLPMLEGREPTEFVLRPLSEREFSICHDMAKTISIDDDGDHAVDVNAGELTHQLLRFSLVEVRGFEGWTETRERLYSSKVMTSATIDQIDRHTAEFLALAVRRWSTLEKKTSSRSGSLQEPTSGTSQTSGGAVRSIAPSVSETKGIDKCTDATEAGGGQG